MPPTNTPWSKAYTGPRKDAHIGLKVVISATTNPLIAAIHIHDVISLPCEAALHVKDADEITRRHNKKNLFSVPLSVITSEELRTKSP
jgi:hypothetical protein